MRKRPKTLLIAVQAASLFLTGHLLAQGHAADSSKVNPPETAGRGGVSAVAVAVPVFGVTADRTEVSIGDPVTVVYSVRLPAGSSLRLDALVTPEPPEGERPPGGAVLEFQPPKPAVAGEATDGEGKVLWKQTVTFIPFLAGTVVVPGPRFSFEERQAAGEAGPPQVLRPPSVTLQVASRLPKDAKPETLSPKDDRPVRLPGPSLLFWAGVAALALLFLAALWWRILRKRRAKGAVAEGPPPVPPGEELLAALEALAREADGLGADPRGFYAELTHAVKRYLERRLDEPVLEWTSFETVRRLREKGIELPKEIGFPDLLSAADVVKFGRGRSTRDAALSHLGRARLLHDSLEARLSPPPAAAATEKAS